ncbi:MAG: DUF971 domain-containing protein [Gammaproteobacteria bacterium]|nr:DUF971 domain-containing protein [Gammaproteobacteria bacterium]
MSNSKKEHPTDITLHTSSRTLEVSFDSGESFNLPWQYLRVFSPSKEVRGRHGKGRILVTGKEAVSITEMKPVGNYALKIFFDDGHNSGLYDWDFLYELGSNQNEYWKQYLAQIELISKA